MARSSASSGRRARCRRNSAWSTASTAGRKTISGSGRSGTGVHKKSRCVGDGPPLIISGTPLEEQMIEDTTGRRSFITGVGAAVAAGAVGSGIAEAQTAPPGRFMASRHADDDWLDKVPGKHRILVVMRHFAMPFAKWRMTITIARSLSSSAYAFLLVAYALDDKDLAIVIVM